MLLALVLALTLTDQEANAHAGPATTLSPVEVTAPATEGTVTLECGYSRDGRLRNCVVISEKPSGYGFAEAALNSARESRLSRRAIEEAAADAKVRFTVRFRLPD